MSVLGPQHTLTAPRWILGRAGPYADMGRHAAPQPSLRAVGDKDQHAAVIDAPVVELRARVRKLIAWRLTVVRSRQWARIDTSSRRGFGHQLRDQVPVES